VTHRTLRTGEDRRPCHCARGSGEAIRRPAVHLRQQSVLALSLPSSHKARMEKPKPKIEFRPTELKDHSGWYVQVISHVVPPLQVGGFKTEEEAKDWVRYNSTQWLAARGGE
jgi:hypothetical protein